jgi:hypothetical protein
LDGCDDVREGVKGEKEEERLAGLVGQLSRQAKQKETGEPRAA